MYDKRVYLDGIRLDDIYIYLTIQWYEHIPGISVSDIIYRLYCDNTPKLQIHNQLLHGNTSMDQIYGTVERHTSVKK